MEVQKVDCKDLRVERQKKKKKKKHGYYVETITKW